VICAARIYIEWVFLLSVDSEFRPLTLSVDVGKGTQDVLVGDLLDENVVKLVLPSPTRILADRIRSVDGDLLCTGYTMGGGPVSKVIKSHLLSNEVVMVESAARTISDDLDEVREMGIRVVGRDEVEVYRERDYSEVRLGDLLLDELFGFLGSFGVERPERIGVGVQDHGVAPEGVSDRRFRFSFFRDVIKKGGDLSEFIFTGETGRFSRIDSVFRQLDGFESLAVDSKIAAVLGCYDGGEEVVVDAGNGHFLAVSLRDNRVVGIFEHHTRMMDAGRIRELLDKLVYGEITDDEVFGDGGHGAFCLESIEPDRIVVTGPRRGIMPSDIDFEYAHPVGDVMMTGAVGLFRAFDLKSD